MVRTFLLPFVMLVASGVNGQDSSKLEQRLKLLNMLDALDFQEAMTAATDCTEQKKFDCARENIAKGAKLAETQSQKQSVEQASENLDRQINLVMLAEEQRAIEKEIEQEKARYEKRQREFARQQQAEAKKAKEREEKQRAAGILVGLVAGSAAVYHGADSDTGVQILEATSAGAYAVMSGDSTAAQEYQTNMAALNEQLEQKKAQQESMFQENLRQQQRAAQMKEVAQKQTAREHYLAVKGRSDLRRCDHKDEQLDAFCKTANAYYVRYVEMLNQNDGGADRMYAMHRATVENMLSFLQAAEGAVTIAAGPEGNRTQRNQPTPAPTANVASPTSPGTGSQEQCSFETVSAKLTPAGMVGNTNHSGPYTSPREPTEAMAMAELEKTIGVICKANTDDAGFALSSEQCFAGTLSGYVCEAEYTCSSQLKKCKGGGSAAARD